MDPISEDFAGYKQRLTVLTSLLTIAVRFSRNRSYTELVSVDLGWPKADDHRMSMYARLNPRFSTSEADRMNKNVLVFEVGIVLIHC